jgi:hypothetical protein
MDTGYVQQQQKIGSAAINSLAKEINDVYFIGPGTVKEVVIVLPQAVDLNKSYIEGRGIVLNVAGTDLVASTKVNTRGIWPNTEGSYVFLLTAYSDFVMVSSQPISVSPLNIEKTISQASSGDFNLIITNNSSNNYPYEVSVFFPDNSSSEASLSSSSLGSITFNALSQNTLSFSLTCNPESFGSYSGKIIFDPLSANDANLTIPVNLVCSSAQSKISFFPVKKNIVAYGGKKTNGNVLVCNNTSTDMNAVLFSFDGDVFSFTGFSTPEKLLANSCSTISFAVNAPNDWKSYLGKLRVSSANFSSSLDVNIVVLDPRLYSFESAVDSTLGHDFNYMGLVYKNNVMNSFQPTGEMDWNLKDTQYDWKDANLVVYYKFNDKNADGWVLNSATGVRDGKLTNGADVNAIGLWDTNALYLDGVNDFVDIGNPAAALDSNLTISCWIYSPFVSRGDIAYKNYNYELDFGIEPGGGINWWQGDGAWEGLGSGSGKIIPNTWAYVTVVRTVSDKKLTYYVNGRYSGVSSYTKDVVASISPILIGSRNTGNSYGGVIDELAIWNKALSESEIVADYNGFVSSRFVDSNIISHPVFADWNSIRINSDANYSFGKEILFGERFFDANLVGLWHFNDKNSGGWMLNSVSGVRDANLNGSADVNGAMLWDNNSLRIPTSGSYSVVHDTQNLYVGVGAAGKFTLSAWVKPTAVNSARAVFSYGRSATCFNYGAVINNGLLLFRNSTNDFNVGSSPYLQANRWSHIVLVSNGLNVSGYVNGYYTGYTTQLPTVCSVHMATIGIRAVNSVTEQFTGDIEELAIWNRALSALEIKELYRKGAVRLDLNVYSCSDYNCLSRTGSQYISGASNGTWIDLNGSVRDSNYLGIDYHQRLNAGSDYNAGNMWVGPYLSDVNVCYIR